MSARATPQTDALVAEFGEFNASPFITLARFFERELGELGERGAGLAAKAGEFNALAHHGSARLQKPEICADTQRAEALDAATRLPSQVYHAVLTSVAMQSLLCLAISDSGSMLRNRLHATAEDTRELARRGWIVDRGGGKVYITDRGNEAVRQLRDVADKIGEVVS